jgi:hypothetical protein
MSSRSAGEASSTSEPLNWGPLPIRVFVKEFLPSSTRKTSGLFKNRASAVELLGSRGRLREHQEIRRSKNQIGEVFPDVVFRTSEYQ